MRFILGLLLALVSTIASAQVTITPAGAVGGGGVIIAPLLAPDGTAAAPSYSFASAPTNGFYWDGGNLNVARSGSRVAYFPTDGFSATKVYIGNATQDVVLERDAANTLAQRNGTTAQILRVYSTTYGSTNDRIELQGNDGTGARLLSNWSSGAGIPLTLGAGGSHWRITTAGHFVAVTDNTYDIGASGATRPRNYFGGGTITSGSHITSGGNFVGAASSAKLVIGATGFLGSEANGVWRVTNDAGTGFTRLILGTNDASGIAIGKAGTTFQFVLGNDSGWAAIAIGNTVAAAAAVPSTHKVTMLIGGVTYYLLATNVP